jgi:hypothetical protein
LSPPANVRNERQRTRAQAALCAVLCSLWACLAQAAGPEPEPATASESSAPSCAGEEPATCGKRLFELGNQAHERGDYAAAVQSFETALAIKPHPVIRFDLALSLSKLGKLRAAGASLELVLADPLSDAALRQRAEQELQRVASELAHLRLLLRDPSATQVELDGERVADPSAELALDPGSHHVRVSDEHAVVYDETLEAHPGEHIQLRVDAGRLRNIDVVVVPHEPAKPATPAAAPHEASSRTLSPVWFWSGVALTGALTGLTVWSGLDTQSAYHSYRRELPTLSQAQADARVSSGHDRERRTNLLLGGALCAGAASATLGIWFVDFAGTRTRAQVSASGIALVSSF